MARCTCVQRVLQAISSSDKPQLGKHAQNQALCLRTMISAVEMNEEQLALLSVRITEIGFPQDIVASLMEFLHSRVSQNKNGKRGNIRLQKWTSFPNYFPQQMWDEMRDLNRVDALKLMLVELIRLGLRHPSCPTYGVMAAVSSVMELGTDQALTLIRDKKMEQVSFVKSVFKNLVEDVRVPAVYCVALPEDVSIFVADYPTLADPFYSAGAAVQYPGDAILLKMVSDGMPLRERVGAKGSAVVEGGHALACRGGGASMQVSDVLAGVMQILNKFSDKLTERREPHIEILPPKGHLKTVLERGPPAAGNGATEVERGLGEGDGGLQVVSQWHDGGGNVTKGGVEEEAPKLTVASKKMKRRRKLLKRNKEGKGKGKKKHGDEENEKEEKAKDKSRLATASILQAMLQRDSLKRAEEAKERAEKAKKKRLEKEAAVGEAEGQSGAPAVSKKPAAAPPKGAKKARRRLGCSKCRYLVNGCAVCRKKAKLA